MSASVKQPSAKKIPRFEKKPSFPFRNATFMERSLSLSEHLSMRFLISGLVAAIAAGTLFCSGLKAEPQRERMCYSTAETRDKIAADGLSEPFTTMRNVAVKAQAEAIGAKLCRRSDELVYEISLLRLDGRVIQIIVDAKTGRTLGSMNEIELRARTGE
jgi:hypothetical protein